MGIFTFRTKEESLSWATEAESALLDIGFEQGAGYTPSTQASYYGHSYPHYSQIWDGEKTQGELGAPVHYTPDYKSLALRSWQAFTESDIAQIIIKSYVDWVIGQGLKLHSEPIKSIIEEEGYTITREFTQKVESRFNAYTNSKKSTHQKNYNFKHSGRKAILQAIVGGDFLKVIRVEEYGPTVQIIDGINVQSPPSPEMYGMKEGNKVVHGVELAPNGEHEAFYVVDEEKQYIRIPAKGEKTGRDMACLVYGSEYRVDGVRGLPLLSAMLEKITKIDRYIEATVGGAEERAKVPYVFEHDQFSDGENPMLTGLLEANNAGETKDAQNSITVEEAAKNVAMTTGKTATNLPVGVKIKALESDIELNLGEFVDTNFIYLCAAAQIPYEVALMKYVNSFSSSRMASESWLHLLLIRRSLISESYYKPFYRAYLEFNVFKGKIKANGFINAINKGDIELYEAYVNCRFTGKGVPRADPKKEIEGEILKIENNLTSRSKAKERIDGDDFETDAEELERENSLLKQKGLLNEPQNEN